MPHIDRKVNTRKKKRLPTWIIMIPIMKEGSWLYVYDRDFDSKMLRIPLGGYLVLRDDHQHGGFCGSAGNVRIQITLIPEDQIDEFRYLNHVGHKIANEKGFYNPKPINYNDSVYIFGDDVKEKLKAQKTDLAQDYSNIEDIYGVD